MSNTQRESIRTKQDRIIELAEAQKLPFDVPISELQGGAPCVRQLESCIWPEYEPSIDSCLRHLENKTTAQ